MAHRSGYRDPFAGRAGLTEEDADRFIAVCEGLFVGQLSKEESETFNELCRAGICRRAYEGAGGFLGLAKVRRTALAEGRDNG